MATANPSRWSAAIARITITALAVAAALHIAAELIRSVLPELIGGLAVAIVGYGLWAFARFRRGRW